MQAFDKFNREISIGDLIVYSSERGAIKVSKVLEVYSKPLSSSHDFDSPHLKVRTANNTIGRLSNLNQVLKITGLDFSK